MENKSLPKQVWNYITIILFIGIVAFSFLLSSRNNEIKSLKEQIKSDEYFEFKNVLVGKWIEISGDTSIYQFNQDYSREFTVLD